MTRYYNIDFLILPHAAAKVEDFLNFTRTIIDTANYTTDGPQQRYSFLFSEKAGKNRDAVCTPLSKLSAATTEGVTVTHTYITTYSTRDLVRYSGRSILFFKIQNFLGACHLL
jgi:hypothetical protein